MKIDLNSAAASQIQVERDNKQGPGASNTPVNSGVLSGVSQDRATLSAASGSVHSLVSQALNSPDVRQGKVDALRQSVSSGAYKADASQTAAAILSSGDVDD